jgi:hypothetical protein
MPMSTRWSDTSPEALEVFLEVQRRRTPTKKLATAFELSDTVRRLSLAGLRLRHPGASERELFLRMVALQVPRELMIRAYGWHPDLGTEPPAA